MYTQVSEINPIQEVLCISQAGRKQQKSFTDTYKSQNSYNCFLKRNEDRLPNNNDSTSCHLPPDIVFNKFLWDADSLYINRENSLFSLPSPRTGSCYLFFV